MWKVYVVFWKIALKVKGVCMSLKTFILMANMLGVGYSMKVKV